VEPRPINDLLARQQVVLDVAHDRNGTPGPVPDPEFAVRREEG